MVKYTVREVPALRSATALVLHCLHHEIFGDAAPGIHPDEGHWWVAFDEEGQPVAFAGVKQGSRPECGYMNRAGVLPAHRGNGLQLRLIRARERRARKNGWTYLVADTTDNPHSDRSLERAGFERYLPDVPWAFENSHYWRKAL